MRLAAKLPRRIKPAVLAMPVAAALALPLIPVTANDTVVPAAEAQSSLGSSGSSLGPGSSTDYLDPDSLPERTPIKVTEQPLEDLPDGVSVDRVEWVTNRWVNLYINTPNASVQGKPMKVQVLLARDWYSKPDMKFPEVWALDGLRAEERESGWTLSTNIAQFYADKNVNVILPVGGESSFYSDWQQPDNGKHYKWESFLINDLPSVLREGWRSNGDRAIAGLSMGGTGAINLAERHPEMFKFAGSFSGYLDTTSFGMPEGIAYATQDGGGYDATKMWGPLGSQDWIDHDPKLGVKALKDMTVYVSSGNGNAGAFDRPGPFPGVPNNVTGMGLEIMARMTSETFVKYAKNAGVDVITKFRPSGTHAWQYWQFEMTQAWPYMAKALNVPEEGQGVECTVGGDIAAALNANPTLATQMGACVSMEYNGPKDGKTQDFRGGRAFWTRDTGAHFVWGTIGAVYGSIGGPESFLGYPKSEEYVIATPTNPAGGRFVEFEGGNIYWTPATGAHPVSADFMAEWKKTGYEQGPLGYPISGEEKVLGGVVQKFQNGVIVRKDGGEPQYVQGAIAAKYMELGGPADSGLGWPTSDELDTPKVRGKYTTFDKGSIYWSPATGAHAVLAGPMMDAWKDAGYENGQWGFPIEEQKDIAAGGISQKFSKGTVTITNGQVKFTPNA